MRTISSKLVTWLLIGALLLTPLVATYFNSEQAYFHDFFKSLNENHDTTVIMLLGGHYLHGLSLQFTDDFAGGLLTAQQFKYFDTR